MKLLLAWTLVFTDVVHVSLGAVLVFYLSACLDLETQLVCGIVRLELCVGMPGHVDGGTGNVLEAGVTVAGGVTVRPVGIVEVNPGISVYRHCNKIVDNTSRNA